MFMSFAMGPVRAACDACGGFVGPRLGPWVTTTHQETEVVLVGNFNINIFFVIFLGMVL